MVVKEFNECLKGIIESHSEDPNLITTLEIDNTKNFNPRFMPSVVTPKAKISLVVVILLGFVFNSLVSSTVLSESLEANEKLLNEVFTKISSNLKPAKRTIRVKAKNNTIWLEGEVATLSEKEEIEYITKTTEGVFQVVNDIKVVSPEPSEQKPSDIGSRTVSSKSSVGADLGKRSTDSYTETDSEETKIKDAAISKSITDRVPTIRSSGPLRVAVRSIRGIVIINGIAPSLQEKNAVHELASSTDGVVRVENRIKISSPVPDEVIAKKIDDSIRESSVDFPPTVNFLVEKGVVTFSGTVERHSVIDKLLSIALMIEGVKDVNSNVNCPDCSMTRMRAEVE